MSRMRYLLAVLAKSDVTSKNCSSSVNGCPVALNTKYLVVPVVVSRKNRYVFSPGDQVFAGMSYLVLGSADWVKISRSLLSWATMNVYVVIVPDGFSFLKMSFFVPSGLETDVSAVFFGAGVCRAGVDCGEVAGFGRRIKNIAPTKSMIRIIGFMMVVAESFPRFVAQAAEW